MTVIWTIAAFLLALGPLIVFHELGHYAVARACGVKVLRFSVGFGRPLVKWVRGRDQTEWVLSMIPFGGYVAMLDEREAHDAPIPAADLPRAFNRQHVAKRIAIVAAGPAANLLLAVLLYAVLNMSGIEEPRAIFTAPDPQSTLAESGIAAPFEVVAMDGEALRSMVDLRWRLLKIGIDHGSAELSVRGLGASSDATRKVVLDLGRLDTKDFEEDFMPKLGMSLLRTRPTIGEVTDPKGPAAVAGLKRGDRIVAIDGKPIDDVDAFRRLIAGSPGRALAMTVERDAGTVDLSVTPALAPGSTTTGMIGVLPQGQLQKIEVHYGPIDALAHGATQTWDLGVFSLRMIGKMVTGQVSMKNISGPLTIADYAKKSAQLGLLPFISFVAFISISLGVMNLLPIPMLDGGHLLYYSAEIVRGRPPSERFLEWSQRAGMFLLAGLMVVALFNDFARLLS